MNQKNPRAPLQHDVPELLSTPHHHIVPPPSNPENTLAKPAQNVKKRNHSKLVERNPLKPASHLVAALFLPFIVSTGRPEFLQLPPLYERFRRTPSISVGGSPPGGMSVTVSRRNCTRFSWRPSSVTGQTAVGRAGRFRGFGCFWSARHVCFVVVFWVGRGLSKMFGGKLVPTGKHGKLARMQLAFLLCRTGLGLTQRCYCRSTVQDSLKPSAFKRNRIQFG